MKSHPHRDIRKLLAPLFKRGWVFAGITKHYKIRSPRGRLVSVSMTPANSESIVRIAADIARIEKEEQ
jgi:hypothetical protein